MDHGSTSSYGRGVIEDGRGEFDEGERGQWASARMK